MNLSTSTILIVDDSDDVRTIVRIFLERDAAFSVCGEAASGPEAIAKAQELKPDFVLLDLRLPGMNGIETATALKAILPQTKLVLFSAYADFAGQSKLGLGRWSRPRGTQGQPHRHGRLLKTLAKSA